LFNDFPPMEGAQPMPLPSQGTVPEMHCSGCGSKVGEKVLTRALKRVRSESPDKSNWPYRNNIIAGLDAPDDAAVVQIPPGKLAVHTVDHFSALIDDPFVFSQICVNHCLSDLFAMGAISHSVLAIATIPYGPPAKQEESLYHLLSGATHALAKSNTFLVGGHTTEGATLSLGFACNGWIDPQDVWRKSGMEPGQSLIVTKALGTGTLFAADMQLQAKGRWIEAAVESMLQSNQAAAKCLKQQGATACTDVTGFGLAGHLLEMAAASHVGVELDLTDLEFLPGADTTLDKKIVSSLHSRNLASAIDAFHPVRIPNHLPIFQVLFDPQTSGGLLASIPAHKTTECLNALHQLGYTASCCIGTVTELAEKGRLDINPSKIERPETNRLTNTKPLTIKQW
ncbi:MAG: selenide, water dikinase SelD, partial [Cyanobacteria bacterium J06555_13]